MGRSTQGESLYRVLMSGCRGAFRALCRLDVQGLEHVPPDGALVVAPNHLHSLDIPLVGAIIPRRQCVLAADKWRGTPGGWVMEAATRVIYIQRGEADRRALSAALAVLNAGGALAVAPEGTRSRTGGLLQGKNGTAYLALRSGAPILPVALWGQESSLRQLTHLRRPLISIRIGPCLQSMRLSRRPDSADVEALTERLMLTLAGMLPPEYRGHYRECLKEQSAWSTDP